MTDHLLSTFESQIRNQEQLLREREQELDNLRQTKEQLADLTRRRAELQADLLAVETDIAQVERDFRGSLARLDTRLGGGVLPREPDMASSRPPVAPAAAPAPAAEVKPSLRDLLRKAMKASRTPVSGPDLATKVLAAGYKTTSRDFPNIVKTTLAGMDDVEHVKGQGYKLKAGGR